MPRVLSATTLAPRSSYRVSLSQLQSSDHLADQHPMKVISSLSSNASRAGVQRYLADHTLIVKLPERRRGLD